MLISESILERAGVHSEGSWDEWLPTVKIDSREVARGDLFWALAGERSDGHEYVKQAFDAGAAIVAVRELWLHQHPQARQWGTLFVMEDTLAGLQKLATEVRRSLGAQTLALTGSNGKTTMKELIAAALSPTAKTSRSPGNRNNEIGLPLSLLNADGDETYLVLEMGANHGGEIARLSEIAHPEYGLITNIGDAHVGEFGGYEALQAAKGELFDFLAREEGLAFVNLEDPKVVAESAKVARRVGYSLGQVPEGWRGGVYLGRLERGDHWGRVGVEVDGHRIDSRLTGRHWALACVGAYAAAVEMGADPEGAARGISRVEPVSGRGNIVALPDGCELLDDSYNANAASIEAGLRTLASRPGKRIALLADVLELGEYEEEEHRRLGRTPELGEIDRVLFLGARMSWAAEEAEWLGHAEVFHLEEGDHEGAAELILSALEPGTGILVKGSRKMGLERVVELLCQRAGQSTDEGAR